MTSLASDTLFYVEVILIAIFIIMQFISSTYNRRYTSLLEDLFPDNNTAVVIGKFPLEKVGTLTKQALQKLLSSASVIHLERHDFFPVASVHLEDDSNAIMEKMMQDVNRVDIEVMLLRSPRESSITFNEIISKLNLYLLRNKQNQVDFNIVRDIIERECESQEEQAYNGIQMPLYWGLLGTILGIAVGLAALLLPSTGDPNSTLGLIGGEKVNKLLMAVSIAMTGSFTGLLLTIISTLRHKKAVAKLYQDKHDFYHFLQTELLPTLPKTMGGVVEKLQKTLNSFNDNFSKNLKSFDQNITAVHTNLSVQQSFLNQLANLDINDIVQGNIIVLQELQKSTKHFKQFIAYQEGLNFTIDKVNNASNSLANTGERMQSVISELELIKSNSSEIAKTLGAQQAIFQHINELFESDTKIIHEWKSKIRMEVENLDKVMQDNIEALQEHSIEHFANVKKVLEKEFIHLEKTFESSQNRFSDLEYLKHLEKLEKIQEGLEKSNNQQLQKELLLTKVEQEKTNLLLEKLVTLQQKENDSIIQDILKKLGYGKKKK